MHHLTALSALDPLGEANGIPCSAGSRDRLFWAAYVLTRPLGASIADGLGKPRADHGLGWGAGPVAAGFAVLMLVMVGYLALTGRDVQPGAAAETAAPRLDAERV